MRPAPRIVGTTNLAVRRGDRVVLAGDGQVTLENAIVKGRAKKIRRLADGSVVPPCGHVAGSYAAGDADRGVGSAPANRELAGVFDLVPAPTPADIADLVSAGVNPLRSLPGRGLRVWGARTLAGADQPEWTASFVSE